MKVNFSSKPASPRVGSASPKSGQMLVAVAVMMVGLLGVLGLVTDIGLEMSNKRWAQRAADAAAQAGARELRFAWGATQQANARTAALEYAVRNGINPANVQIEAPPFTSALYNGSNKYVRVRIKVPTRLEFMRILVHRDSADVYSAATAGIKQAPIPFTLLVLDKIVKSACSVSGGGDLQVLKGAIHVNSSDAAAVTIANGATITTSLLEVVGGIDHPDQVTGPTCLGVGAEQDPFSYIAEPAFTQYDTSPTCTAPYNKPNSTSVSGSQTLQPGVYWGGITINAGSTITFQPGVYIMAGGGMSVSGGATLIGNGVMFYNTYDPYNNSGQGRYADISLTGGHFALKAPQSGTYKGILFFNSRDAANTTSVKLAGQFSIPPGMEGTGVPPLCGFIYTPNSLLSMAGGSGSEGLSAICKTFSASGGGQLGVADNYTLPEEPVVRLVE